ncbi:MAG TPA: hypothetical protein VN658_08425 [Candidatus Acidoferrales bacterium]|nr:hypothetical protein [Candidatus Acidoferrales bacterium]
MKESSIAKSIIRAMQRLVNSRFFSRDVPDPGVWRTIGWWEVRRVPYNLLVGLAGVVTCVVCFITALVCGHFLGDPIGLPDPPGFAFLGIAAYGVMANICYTGGWTAELMVQQVWPDEGKAFGKISFFLGLIFSILLTLVPGGLISAIGAIRLLMHFSR